MTDMRYKIAGIVRQAIYDHEAYIDSPEIIAASAIMALQQARIDKLEAARDKAILELWPWVSVGFDMPADTQREKYTLEVIKNALEALKKGQDLEALKLKEDE